MSQPMVGPYVCRIRILIVHLPAFLELQKICFAKTFIRGGETGRLGGAFSSSGLRSGAPLFFSGKEQELTVEVPFKGLPRTGEVFRVWAADGGRRIEGRLIGMRLPAILSRLRLFKVKPGFTMGGGAKVSQRVEAGAYMKGILHTQLHTSRRTHFVISTHPVGIVWSRTFFHSPQPGSFIT